MVAPSLFVTTIEPLLTDGIAAINWKNAASDSQVVSFETTTSVNSKPLCNQHHEIVCTDIVFYFSISID